MKERLKVSLVQCSQREENKTFNLAHFDDLLEKVQTPTDLIVFPEMFQTGFGMNTEKLAETMKGKSVQWLCEKARKYNAAVVASLMIVEEGKCFNRMVFVFPDGMVSHYDKRKLFTFSREEHYFHPGNEKVIVEYKGWKILLQVCYDLRFPEIQRNKVDKGNYDYDLMINVANWPEQRITHWKTLLQARAIENQAYVIGVNRVGKAVNKLNYTGDSMVVSPLGNVQKTKAFEEGVINDEIEAKILKETREKLPFLKDQ